MRTQKEILNKYKEIEDEDIFGFMRGDLVEYMEFDTANKANLLKEDVTKDQWADPSKPTEEHLEKIMYEYMDFAWNKANNFRGLSAARSIWHYTIWTWLHSDEAHAVIPDDYEYYGKDVLVAICEHFGWDHTEWDDGVRRNSE